MKRKLGYVLALIANLTSLLLVLAPAWILREIQALIGVVLSKK